MPYMLTMSPSQLEIASAHVYMSAVFPFVADAFADSDVKDLLLVLPWRIKKALVSCLNTLIEGDHFHKFASWIQSTWADASCVGLCCPVIIMVMQA